MNQKSVFNGSLHRYFPLLAFWIVYIATCCLGAILFLLDFRYFIILYKYFSGTQVPELAPDEIKTSIYLLFVAPLALSFGYILLTSPALVRRLPIIPEPVAASTWVYKGAVGLAFAFSAGFALYSLDRGGALAKIGNWTDYASWVASRWHMFRLLGYFEFVNLYIVLPVTSAWLLLVLPVRGWKSAVLSGVILLFVVVCSALMFLKKTVVISLIIISCSIYLSLVKNHVRLARSIAISGLGILCVVYLALVVLPVYSDTSRTVKQAEELMGANFGIASPDLKLEGSDLAAEQRRLKALGDELRLGENRTVDVLFYALMAPLTRTSAPALFYPMVFPRHHPYYGLDLGQDILGFGSMPDDTIVVWHYMNPDISGSTAAPFQFVLYSQVGLVGAMFATLVVGLVLGLIWSISQAMLSDVLRAVGGTGVILFSVYIAIDSLRNSVTASYGVLWFAMGVFCLWMLIQVGGQLLAKTGWAK